MVGENATGDDLRIAVTRRTHLKRIESGELVFHRCQPDPNCRYCAPSARPDPAESFDWSFLDAAYCISLQTRDDRAAQAAEEFHRVGLCRLVVFCRPTKEDRTPKKNIWRSHQAVAGQARATRGRRVLILEDDVVFSPGLTPETVREVAEALARLPEGWMALFLGHWPIWSYFIGRHVVRTSSLCTHAYIASGRLLRWIRRHPCRIETEPTNSLGERLRGRGIDAAFSALPGMYAFHPMIATQRPSENDHVNRTYRPGEWSRYAMLKNAREYLVTRHMRTAEVVAGLLSPLTRLFANRAGPPESQSKKKALGGR